MLFGSKPKPSSKPNLNIKCKDIVIEPKDNVKYLGADLDQCLTAKSIVSIANSVLQKANARLKFLAWT